MGEPFRGNISNALSGDVDPDGMTNILKMLL